MGLLDSVIGALSGGQQAQGGLGSLVSMAANNPQMLQAVTGLLGNDGEHGGLGGLVSKFEQAGLGNVVGSWIGNGQNQPVTGDQLTQVLGSGAVANVAAKLGVSPDQAAGQLSSILPGLINHLTPNGQAPAGGLGNSGELMSMLGGLLQKQ
ncbi:MAG TPA: YidB family protein [Rhodoferax sp.]|nr:YidB family protein [Rhodoferax sp.]